MFRKSCAICYQNICSVPQKEPLDITVVWKWDFLFFFSGMPGPKSLTLLGRTKGGFDYHTMQFLLKIGVTYQRHSFRFHCWFLEHWNRQNSLTNIWQCFLCLHDEWIAKISKKIFSWWLFEIIHIICFEIWDLQIWKYFWDMIMTI